MPEVSIDLNMVRITNDDFGGVNVVYRRKDGNYGLLAPELK